MHDGSHIVQYTVVQHSRLPCVEVSQLSACWTFIDIIACAVLEELRHSLFHRARLLLSEHSQAANSLMLNSQVLLALTDYLFNLSWVILGVNIFTQKFLESQELWDPNYVAHIQVEKVLLQIFSYSDRIAWQAMWKCTDLKRCVLLSTAASSAFFFFFALFSFLKQDQCSWKEK